MLSKPSFLVLLLLAFLLGPATAQEAPLTETLEGDKKIYIPFEDLKGVFFLP